MTEEEGLCIMRPRDIRPYIAGVGFATIFGFSFLFTKVALDHVDPLRLIGFRFALAAIAISLLALTKVIKLSFKGKDLRPLLWIAFLQPLAYFFFETTGISQTSSSQAGMMIALIPIVVAVLSSVVLKEKVLNTQWLFIVMSVAGVLFIALMQGASGTGSGLAGTLLLLGAVASAAVFNILSRHSSQDFSPFEITFVMMWTGAVGFTSAALFSHARLGTIGTYFSVLSIPGVVYALLYLGILSSVIAFLLVNYSLSQIPASQAAVFANLTTVVSIIAGVAFRGESFYWYHLIGAVLILGGVWGTNYFGLRAAKRLATEGSV